jgi:hypothetical protein
MPRKSKNTDKSDINNHETEISPSVPIASGKCNYEITLINENLLYIKIVSSKNVSIDCSLKNTFDKQHHLKEKQYNKIEIHPNDDDTEQVIEIYISVGELSEAAAVTDKLSIQPLQKGVFIPNPEVEHLIEKSKPESKKQKSPDEILDEKLGPKNPYNINRRTYEKNIKRATAGGLILYFLMIIIFYFLGTKEITEIEEPHRMVVIQDIIDPTIKTNIDDPVKPKSEKRKETETENKNADFKRIVKIPKIKRPENKDSITAKLVEQKKIADSLEKVNNEKKRIQDSLNLLANKIDTNKKNTGGDKESFTDKDILFSLEYNKENDTVQYVNKEEYDYPVLLSSKKKNEYQLMIVLDEKKKYLEKYKSKFTDTTYKFTVNEPSYKAFRLESSYTDEDNVKVNLLLYYIYMQNNINVFCRADIIEKYYTTDNIKKIDDIIKSLKMKK